MATIYDGIAAVQSQFANGLPTDSVSLANVIASTGLVLIGSPFDAGAAIDAILAAAQMGGPAVGPMDIVSAATGLTDPNAGTGF